MTPRGVTWNGEVSGDTGISLLAMRVSSPRMGLVSCMLEEDIGIETLGGVTGISSSKGFEMGFQWML